MNDARVQAAAFQDAAALVLTRTVEICDVPAPPLQEARRAALVRDWWVADGIEQVIVDDTGNVWGQLRTGAGPALLVAAHLDTVFGEHIVHGARPDGAGRLLGPGVGDDSVAVAALGALHGLLPAECEMPVWIVATVGEEGLGNLAGVSAALDTPQAPVSALIALEGNYLGRVNTVGVGSVRARITVRTPGGHAWEDAEAPSAVHVAAGIIGRLEAERAALPSRTSVNAGTISGGESINSRALQCTFDVDLRSEEPESLTTLAGALGIATAAVPRGVTVEVVDLGRRPAGRIEPGHALVIAAEAALQALGVPHRRTAASTDANAAYARGIPAVTLGITVGDRTHTEDEWIEIAPIETGLRALVGTIGHFTQSRGSA